ncbi:MAG: flagellar hook-length control protein FliK, partial [Fervidobacterium sp.]
IAQKTNNNKDNATLPNIFQNSHNNAYNRYNPYNPYNSNRNVGNTKSYTNTNTNNETSGSLLTNELINQTNQKGEISNINKNNKTKEISGFADSNNLKGELSKSVLNTVNGTDNNNTVLKTDNTDNSVSKKIDLKSNKNVTGKDNTIGNFGDLSKVIDGLSVAVLSFTESVDPKNTKNYSSDINTKDFKLQNSSEKEIKLNNANGVNIQKLANTINTALTTEKKTPINEANEMKSEVRQNLTKSPIARTNQNLSQMTPEKLEKSETNFMALGTTSKVQKNHSPINLSAALDNIVFKIKMPDNVTENLNSNLNRNLDNNIGNYVVKRIFYKALFEEENQNSVTGNDLMIILKNISISITALSTDAISNYIESTGNNKKNYKSLQNLQQINRLSNTSNVGNIADVVNTDSNISSNFSLNSPMNISSQQLSENRNESEFLNEDNQTSQRQNLVGQFRNDSSDLQKNNIEVKSFKIEYREVERNNSNNQSQELSMSDEKTEKPKVSNKFIERLAEMTYKGSKNEVFNTTIIDSGKYDLAERLQASRNLENLYEKIREFNLSNKIEERVQMKLLPENLGMLDVEMKKEGKQLTILFIAENEKAKEMLEKNLYILRDRLNNFDMDVRSIEVKVREEEKFYEQDRQQNNNQNNQREEHRHNGNNENKKRFASEGVSDDDDERERYI